MSNEQLAVLNRTVKATIANRLGDNAAEGFIPSTQTHHIAGLAVPVNLTEQAKTSSKAKKVLADMQKTANNMAALESMLKTHNIQPLAMLPQGIWESLCKKAGLFRLTPQGNTAVFDAKGVAAAISKPAAEKQSSLAIISFLVLVGVVFAVTAGVMGWHILASDGFSFTTESIVSAFVGGLVSGAIAAVVTFFITIKLFMNLDPNNSAAAKRRVETKAIRNSVARHTQQNTLPTLLWPDLIEPQQGERVRFSLPAAPADVQAILVKAEGLNMPLHVAAVGAAITIQDGVTGLLLKTREIDWTLAEQEEILRAAFDNDPIVYVQKDGVVAILAQFGDFPIEKAVIEHVLAEWSPL